MGKQNSTGKGKSEKKGAFEGLIVKLLGKNWKYVLCYVLFPSIVCQFEGKIVMYLNSLYGSNVAIEVNILM